MKLLNLNSVYLNKTKIPYFTNMVIGKYIQTEDNEIVCFPATQANNISGIGRYNCGIKLDNPEAEVEVYVSLDDPQFIESEFKREASGGTVLTEANSQVTWFRVGYQDSNGSGYFEFFTPITFIKIKFIGTGKNSVTFAMN